MTTVDVVTISSLAREAGCEVIGLLEDVYTGEFLVMLGELSQRRGEGEHYRVWSYTHPAGFYNGDSGSDEPPPPTDLTTAMQKFEVS